MTITVRKLPANVNAIVDAKTVPDGHALTNPSFSAPIMYMRGIMQKKNELSSYIVLVDVSSSQSKSKTTQIETPWNMLAPHVNVYNGLEDLRICRFEGRLWFAGTCTHASSRMTNELVIGYFNATNTAVERLCAVDIGYPKVKNICPFVWRDALHIFDAYARCIYRVEEDKGVATAPWRVNVVPVVKLKKPKGTAAPYDDFRGSTSPVHLHGNVWGCVVHDVISANENTKLSYLHYWVEFDIEMGQITFVSTPFFIAHWGVEYVSGIYYKPGSAGITIYLGVQDKQAVVAETTLAHLRAGRV